jgi:hypothetical protein
MEDLPYPTVKEYMIWVRNRMTVTFRRLDQPKVNPSLRICFLLSPHTRWTLLVGCQS